MKSEHKNVGAYSQILISIVDPNEAFICLDNERYKEVWGDAQTMQPLQKGVWVFRRVNKNNETPSSANRDHNLKK